MGLFFRLVAKYIVIFQSELLAFLSGRLQRALILSALTGT